MAQTPSTGIPGVAQANSGYPQYGVGGGTPGSAAGWNIVTAQNESQKTTYSNEGYLVWFSSKSAAQSYISSESSVYGSGELQNAIPGLSQIGDFFGALTQASTWERVLLVVVGGGLILVAVATLFEGTSVGKAATKAAGTAALL